MILIKFLWQYLVESNLIKTSAASAVGSGAVVLGLIEVKMAEIKEIAARDKTEIISYVDYKHTRAVDKIDFLIESQADMKISLKIIDDRLYHMNKKMRE